MSETETPEETHRRRFWTGFMDRMTAERASIVREMAKGREQACVLTKLDEAAMWAEAALAGRTPIGG